MIIHRDRKKRTRRRATLFITGVLLVYVIFFSPLASFFSNASHSVAVPFWKTGNAADETVSPFLSYFSSRRELYLKNKELKAQVTSMAAKVVERDRLREENKVLKEMLGRNDEDERVLAVVLAKPSQTPYDTLVIDVGNNKDIRTGSLVVFENIAIGKVEEVFTTSSKVTLFSSAGATTSVAVGEEALSATAIGLGGGNFEIQLPKNTAVSIGDTVYLPEFHARIFGIVERIESATKDAFEKVLFKSPTSLFTLSKVEVVR